MRIHKKGPGNRFPQSFFAIQQAAGSFFAINHRQPSMGSLPVLLVHVEAGAVHGRDDFVE